MSFYTEFPLFGYHTLHVEGNARKQRERERERVWLYRMVDASYMVLLCEHVAISRANKIITLVTMGALKGWVVITLLMNTWKIHWSIFLLARIKVF